MNPSYYKFIINLDNRPNRFYHSINELKKIHFNDFLMRIKACDIEFAKKNTRFASKNAICNIKNRSSSSILPNYNALACALSHIKCWKFIVNNNIKYSFIIEDDLKINSIDEFKLNLNTIYQYSKCNLNNTALLLTFKNSEYNSNNIHCFDYNNCKKINTNFYFINLKMAKLLLIELVKIEYQIDIQIACIASKYFNSFDYKFMHIKSNCIQQCKKFKSDIQTYIITKKNLYKLFQNFNIHYECCDLIYDFLPYWTKILNYNSQGIFELINHN